MLVAAFARPAVADDVGSVGAANPSSLGAAPGSAARQLVIGAPVVFNEQIKTSADGTANVTFLDRSTLSIGRNSSITIDKFVYDPQARTGQMVATMTKGVMRFIGGQVSHTKGVEINTPTATIGVRGGIVTIIFTSKGMMVIDHFGHVDVTNSVSHQFLSHNNFALLITGSNVPIGAAFVAPPDILTEAFALTASHPGQSGGTKNPPTEAFVSSFGIGAGSLPNDPASGPGLDTIGIINLGQTFVANKSQQQQWNTGSTPPHHKPPPCDCNGGGGGDGDGDGDDGDDR